MKDINNPDIYPLILYDGYCALCNWFVRFILHYEQAAEFNFSALDSDLSHELKNKLQIPKNLDSVLLIYQTAHGKIRYKSKMEAFYLILDKMQGPVKLLKLLKLIPLKISNKLYDLIARYRKKIWKQYDNCPLPDKSVRKRFVT